MKEVFAREPYTTLLYAHHLYCLHTWLADEDIRQAIQSSLSGDILQVPPMYSALKVKGQKLYNLARDGQTIERCVGLLRIAIRKGEHSGGALRGGLCKSSLNGQKLYNFAHDGQTIEIAWVARASAGAGECRWKGPSSKRG